MSEKTKSFREMGGYLQHAATVKDVHAWMEAYIKMGKGDLRVGWWCHEANAEVTLLRNSIGEPYNGYPEFVELIGEFCI